MSFGVIGTNGERPQIILQNPAVCGRGPAIAFRHSSGLNRKRPLEPFENGSMLPMDVANGMVILLVKTVALQKALTLIQVRKMHRRGGDGTPKTERDACSFHYGTGCWL